jgi:hypothetical protein
MSRTVCAHDSVDYSKLFFERMIDFLEERIFRYVAASKKKKEKENSVCAATETQNSLFTDNILIISVLIFFKQVRKCTYSIRMLSVL